MFMITHAINFLFTYCYNLFIAEELEKHAYVHFINN